MVVETKDIIYTYTHTQLCLVVQTKDMIYTYIHTQLCMVVDILTYHLHIHTHAELCMVANFSAENVTGWVLCSGLMVLAMTESGVTMR
jgi:hypothetical protein